MGDRLSALTANVALTAQRVAKAPTTSVWRRAGVICRISSSDQRRLPRRRNEPGGYVMLGGSVPDGRTCRLILLPLCVPPLERKVKVQQPAVGTSTMLG